MKTQHYFRSQYVSQRYPEVTQLWDHVLFESDSFVAVPSLGSLVAGWLLIVPKFSVLSMGCLNYQQHEELDVFLRSVAANLEREFGPVAIFEHGPLRKQTSVGCGVDYAHLHLVATDCDLLKYAKTVAPNIHWKQASSLRDTVQTVSENSPYLYLQQSLGSGNPVIGISTDIPSQLFRKAIANYIGLPHLSDWKEYSGIENIIKTISALKNSQLQELTAATV